MFLFDLHCDTLTQASDKGKGLMNDGLRLSIDRIPGHRWCQCFAIWVPDELRGAAAWNYFERNARFFRAQMNLHLSRMQPARTPAEIEAALDAGRIAAILTVESGAALAGDIQNAKRMAALGVKMMTLTWNAENELAGGCHTDQGFHFFGRMIVPILEQNGIIIDVSHLSDKAFWELGGFAKRPIIASHSNARAVTDHPRNLTDRQFGRIREGGGLVGLNCYSPFLRAEGEATVDDLCRHIEHFLALGGAETVALGMDLDGAEVMPSWIQGVQDIPALYEVLCMRFGAAQTDQLFGQNAAAFFRRYEALGMLLDALR